MKSNLKDPKSQNPDFKAIKAFSKIQSRAHKKPLKLRQSQIFRSHPDLTRVIYHIRNNVLTLPESLKPENLKFKKIKKKDSEIIKVLKSAHYHEITKEQFLLLGFESLRREISWSSINLMPVLNKIKKERFQRLPINQIKISLASPEQIKKWCSRLLPTGANIGEIKNAQTINYKTDCPIKNGLFCQQIFGPIKDFRCGCGKTVKEEKKEMRLNKSKYNNFCSKCNVEFTKKRVRRYNLGYIKLNSSVTHIWFLRGRVSYISILLGYKRKFLEKLSFCQRIVQFPQNIKIKTFVFLPLFFKSCDRLPLYWSSLLSFPHDCENNYCFEVITPQPIQPRSLRKDSQVGEKKKKEVQEWFLKKPFGSIAVSEPSADQTTTKKREKGEKREKREKKSIIKKNHHLFLFYKKMWKGEKWRRTKEAGVLYTKPFPSDMPPFSTLLKSKGVVDTANSVNRKGGCKIVVGFLPGGSPEPGFALSVKNKRNEKSSTKSNRVCNQKGVSMIKTFLQPTLFPYLPTIASQKYDHRFGKIPLFYFKNYDQPVPVWDDLLCLMFFTVSPKEGDIPIPDYSQLTSHPKNNIFEHDSLLEPLAFHKKHLANTGGTVIKRMLKKLNLPVMAEILKKILFKVNKEISKITLNLISKPPIWPFEFEGLEAEKNRIIYNRRIAKLQNTLVKLKNYQFKKVRSAKIIRDLIKSKMKPEWMILDLIPVLPPELRPILRLDKDQLAVSDLNKIYQNIFYRNARFTNKYKLNSLSMQSLLQKAVDALIDNGKGGNQSMCASNGRPLKSLSDILKGKGGLFRQNLLGKRVDYSGRSVIIVGPYLKLYQCGLPKEMAIELFHVFLIRDLILHKIVETKIEAKHFIEKKNLTLWSILDKIMQRNLVILNRAPTLHRLGIQAFQPKLVNGRAILLHPLVCTAFNADFDGDQMGVHIPLSKKAQAEAQFLMWSTNNIISPATGQPILVPSQDMILGCNYLTYLNEKVEKKKIEQKQTDHKGYEKCQKIDTEQIRIPFENPFSDFNDLLRAYHQDQILLHLPVWVQTNLSLKLETELPLLSPLESRLNRFGELTEIFFNLQLCYDKTGQIVNQYLRTTPGRVIVNKALFG